MERWFWHTEFPLSILGLKFWNGKKYEKKQQFHLIKGFLYIQTDVNEIWSIALILSNPGFIVRALLYT